MVTVCPSQFATRRTLFHVLVGCGLLMLKVSRLKLPVIWLLVSMWLNTLTKSQIWIIHITIIELNALHTKRQNLFQELDAVIHLLMEAKHWGLRKSRNATSLNSRFKSLDTLKV